MESRQRHYFRDRLFSYTIWPTPTNFNTVSLLIRSRSSPILIDFRLRESRRQHYFLDQLYTTQQWAIEIGVKYSHTAYPYLGQLQRSRSQELKHFFSVKNVSRGVTTAGDRGDASPVRPTMSPLHQSDNRHQFVFGADF